MTAGAPGRRTALPHARLRVGSAAVGVGEQLRREIVAITARRSGREAARIVADGGRWFSAVEARDYGLVDAVAG